ncbi:hypothetical protein D3C76_1721690 [compost metagenome]
MPLPVWNFHSSLPVLASKALKKPSPVPVNTRLPLVANTPAHNGRCSLCSQTSLPVVGSMARNVPTWSSYMRLIRKPMPR